MSKYAISLLQVPNQKISVNLQNAEGKYISVDIGLRSLYDGSLVADITVNGKIQRLCGMCTNLMPLIPTNTVGGNLYFQDIYGNNDPQFSEFNDRYQLIYDSEYKLV